MTSAAAQRRLVTVCCFCCALIPAALLAWNALNDQLSANPIKDITEATGTWTLRFVMITLAIRPLRRIPQLGWLGARRRMAGLFTFFYGLLHLSTYVWLDQFFDLDGIAHDIVKRPFITAGMTAFALMIPLAATSTRGWIRRMGGARWKALHRLVYATAICGVIHYLWLVKADRQRPLIYGAVLAVLLGYRLWEYWMRRRSAGNIS